MEKNADQIALLESLDNGGAIKVSQIMVKMSIDYFRYYAGYADKVHGQVVIPIEGPYLCYTRHEAVGVVAAIIPWNAL